MYDFVQEGLHLIDLSAGGHVQIPEPVLNPETKRALYNPITYGRSDNF